MAVAAKARWARGKCSDYIYVPVDQRGAPLPTIPVISVRLSHILAYKGWKTFGDLHGFRLSEIRSYRHCGKHTILELEALVKGVQGGVTSLEHLKRGAFIELPPTLSHIFFSVAPAARDLKPQDLPLSVRAENTLKRLGVQRLGDLERVTVSEMTGLKNCGAWTIREIQTLLQRASAGEFSVTPEALQAVISCDLLAQIDGMLGQLPNRDLEIVALRLGGSGQPPATLDMIGLQFNISRERVRQIVSSTLGKLVRLGGPKTKILLNAIAASCHSNVCPLKLDLLRNRAPKPCPLRYKPEFYLRAIAVMRPDIRPAESINPSSWPPI
jgi:hypothetical protein